MLKGCDACARHHIDTSPARDMLFANDKAHDGSKHGTRRGDAYSDEGDQDSELIVISVPGLM